MWCCRTVRGTEDTSVRLKVKEATMWLVVRKAVIMEDEGRLELIKPFESRAEAEAWIAAQSNEYFKPWDYVIFAEV